MLFEQDNATWFVVSPDAEYKDYIHEELIWAEMTESLGGAIKVHWEDSFDKPEFFDTFNDARQHILNNYNLHQPLSQGGKYYIGK